MQGTEKRKLYLQHDRFGIYNCPVHHCEHGGFNSKRGCRKHIDTKHSWFYFFDEKPAVQLNRYINEEGTADCTWAIRKKANTRKIPHFPVNEGIGKDFVSWLSSACGGGVAKNQAKQQSVRIMKFLKYCSEDDKMKFREILLITALALLALFRNSLSIVEKSGA